MGTAHNQKFEEFFEKIFIAVNANSIEQEEA